MVEMFVARIALDVEQGNAMVVLADEPEERLLPIFIGIFEANAIATELRGVRPERPMTHDLLASIISELGCRMERVTITTLRENTFYALITLARDGEKLEIDARPSDSIALALRCDARIFVTDEVLEQAKFRPMPDDEIERFEELMSQVDLPVEGDEPPLPEEPEEPGE